MPENPKLENAKTEIFGFGVLFSLMRRLTLSLPLGEMSRSDREGWNQLVWLFKFALIRICQRATPSVTACAVPPSSERKALVLRAIQSCLSLWERCRAATERAGSLVRELDLPQAKTEGVLQIDKIRLRLALMQTCPRAAPSVTAYAVPPSSGRKALVLRAI